MADMFFFLHVQTSSAGSSQSHRSQRIRDILFCFLIDHSHSCCSRFSPADSRGSCKESIKEKKNQTEMSPSTEGGPETQPFEWY